MFKIDFSRAQAIADKMSNDDLREIAEKRVVGSDRQQMEMKAYAEIAMALQAGFSPKVLKMVASEREKEINAPELERQSELEATEKAAKEYRSWKARN